MQALAERASQALLTRTPKQLPSGDSIARTEEGAPVSERVAIVGPGRMGLALGVALLRSGSVERITFQGRSLEPPPHPIFDHADDDVEVEYRIGLVPPRADTTALVLAVPDTALAEVAWLLAAAGPAPVVALSWRRVSVSSTACVQRMFCCSYRRPAINVR